MAEAVLPVLGDLMEEDRENGVDGGGTYVEIVKWEGLKKNMVLRVLLVETDDSTRKIISALLRKSGFRVSPASDGLEAWGILKEKHSNIDLVLTEVELPNMSGYALLSMIMENENCKSIPVIMMSCQHSMNMVFKCMLKGAVDFLVKPMRKNELRNLWQHVWRRQLTNESPESACAQKKVENPAFLSSAANSECNSVSNHSTEDVDSIHEERERVTKGSDTQSSCTRPNELKHINSSDEEEKKDKGREDVSDKETSSIQEDHNTQHESDEQNLYQSSGYKRCRVLEAGSFRSQTVDVDFDETQALKTQLQPPPFSNLENEANKLNHSRSSAFSWYSARPTPATDQHAPDTVHSPVIQVLYGPTGPTQKPAQEDQSSDRAGSVVTSENGAPPRVSAEREAALTKFRLKRKDRCFEKKVRYQSRKTLAEQRPRVKGQFVRQVKPGV